MSDLTNQLLSLIKLGATVNEISEILGLSNKQIYNLITMIKNKGYEFERKYYYNGDIVYVPKKTFVQQKERGTNIITTHKDNKFIALIISDLHIGSIYERIDLINIIFDYCKQNEIHSIFICGDLIDGMIGPYDKKHQTIEEQIDYAIKSYPFDKNILSYVVLGNHDYNSLKEYGQNLSTILESYRHDIIPLGYGISQINIKNDKIILKHPLNSSERIDDYPSTKTIICRGHSHKTKVISSSKSLIVNISSLSDRTFSDNEILPGAMLMTLEFNKGYFNKVRFQQLLIANKIYTINELEFQLGYNKNNSEKETIKHEEEPHKKLVLSKTILTNVTVQSR